MKSLLNVSRKADLGLRLISELALRKEAPVSLEEVARKTKASRKFLEEIAGDLRRAGLVEGIRGAAGGYRLARDPKTLTVAEVMNAIEGTSLDACTAHGVRAEIGIISKVQGQVMATLMNTVIADIV